MPGDRSKGASAAFEETNCYPEIGKGRVVRVRQRALTARKARFAPRDRQTASVMNKRPGAELGETGPASCSAGRGDPHPSERSTEASPSCSKPSPRRRRGGDRTAYHRSLQPAPARLSPAARHQGQVHVVAAPPGRGRGPSCSSRLLRDGPGPPTRRAPASAGRSCGRTPEGDVPARRRMPGPGRRVLGAPSRQVRHRAARRPSGRRRDRPRCPRRRADRRSGRPPAPSPPEVVHAGHLWGDHGRGPDPHGLERRQPVTLGQRHISKGTGTPVEIREHGVREGIGLSRRGRQRKNEIGSQSRNISCRVRVVA